MAQHSTAPSLHLHLYLLSHQSQHNTMRKRNAIIHQVKLYSFFFFFLILLLSFLLRHPTNTLLKKLLYQSKSRPISDNTYTQPTQHSTQNTPWVRQLAANAKRANQYTQKTPCIPFFIPYCMGDIMLSFPSLASTVSILAPFQCKIYPAALQP